MFQGITHCIFACQFCKLRIVLKEGTVYQSPNLKITPMCTYVNTYVYSDKYMDGQI